MKRRAEALAAIVGRDHVRFGGRLASPASPAELSAVLRRCGEMGARVRLPARHGEKRPPRTVTLDLGRLSVVSEIDVRSRVVRVGAGARLQDVEQELRPHGLTLGPWVPREPRTTLGAMLQQPLATDRSPLYGRFVDLCIGLEAVRPDGTPLTWRLAPRKAAGPDWRGLVIGGGGWAAVVTSLWLRVHGIPETRRVQAFAFPSRHGALCAAREAVRREVRPATWWCTTVLTAEMEGPESIVAAEARTLEETARAAKGRAVAPLSRPRGRARHGSWTEILGARGAASEMTLDGACAHGAEAPVPQLDAGLARRLDPRGVLLGRGA